MKIDRMTPMNLINLKKNFGMCFLTMVILAASGLACGSDDGGSQNSDYGHESDASLESDGGGLLPDAGEVGDSGTLEDSGENDAADDSPFVVKAVPAGDEAQMNACYVPTEFPAVSFDKYQSYRSEMGNGADQEASFEFLAYDEYENDTAQALWVEIYPQTMQTTLTGTFDLSKEKLDYGTCEHCVVIQAASRETSDSMDKEKHYMPVSGTLTLQTVSSSAIQGTMRDASFVEVRLSESKEGKITTEKVEDGCATFIPQLSFEFKPLEIPEHVAKCYVPEKLNAREMTDYVIGLDVDTKKDRYFYRTMSVPAMGSGMPSITYFIEVYQGGTGTFSFDNDCVHDGPDCLHHAIIETIMPSGKTKTYVADSGTLTLTTLTPKLMEGELSDVHFVETLIYEDDSGSTVFEPVPNGCETSLDLFVFSSADATE